MNLQNAFAAAMFALIVLVGPTNYFAVADDKSEIDRLSALAQQANSEEQWDRAIELYAQVYELQKSVYGENHLKLIETLDLLSQVAEMKQDYQACIGYLERQQVMIEKLYGRDDYRTEDASRAVAYAKERVAFTREQQKRLSQADAHRLKMTEAYQSRNYAAGIQAATACLAIEKEVLGDQHPDYANSLSWLAVLYKMSGDYAKVELLEREALTIQEKILGKQHPEYATKLNNLAQFYLSRADFAKAEPLYHEALAIRRKVLGAQHPDYAVSLNNLAVFYETMGDLERAEPLFREAVDVKEKALGNQHPSYATSLNNLAELYRTKAEYGRAEPLYLKAIAIQEVVLGKKHPDYATSLANLSGLYRTMSDYGRAERLLSEAIAIFEITLGKEHPNYATSLLNLAELYSMMGHYARAVPLIQDVAAYRKKALGDMHPDYATCLNNLAVLYYTTGDYARAEPLYRESLAITEKVLGKEHPSYANSLNALAALYKAMSDFARAEPLHREALAIREKKLGKLHPDYATSLHNLAGLYRSMGDNQKAETLYLEALSVWESAVGKAHRNYAASVNNLSSLYYATGEYQRAAPLLREATAIWEVSLGKEHPDFAASLVNLAELYRLMADYPQAEPLAREAIAIFRKVLGDQHPDFATSLSNLACLYESMGDSSRAEPLYREAVEITLRNLELTASVQSQRQQVSMGDSLRKRLDSYLSLATQEPQFQAAAYAALLRWKGSVWQRQQRQRLLLDEPSLKPGFDALREVSSKLSTLILRTPDPKQLDVWRRQLDELSDQREKLERDLSLASAAFRQASSLVTSEQLRASLPEGTMLVDFLEFTHFTPANKEKQTKESQERRLLVHLVRGGDEVRAIDLGPVDAIADLVQTWRRDLGGSPAAVAAAAQLRKQIWEPLAEHLSGITMVYVSPDGLLGQFPLAALPGKKSGSYLIEEVAIAILPVPQTLPSMNQLVASANDANEDRFCLVGGVDYEQVTAPSEPVAPATPATPSNNPASAAPLILAARGSEPNIYQPLPGTTAEIETIESLLRVHRPSATTTILRGAQASEAAFSRAAQGHRYLHVATHGFFAPESVKNALTASTPEAYRLLRSDDSRYPKLVGQHPDLLSGIVFAGSNHAPEGAADDGILTAAEVQSLDLRNVELAILSACETGLGATAGGEGIIGLQRAFQLAGARATITSLWQVDDTATQTLMVEFYRNLFDRKLSKLESLRQAQITMLNRYDQTTGGFTRGLGGKSEQVNITTTVPAPANAATNRLSPAFWAAFQLSGDPR